MSKTEEVTVTSEERVSRQRQSPGQRLTMARGWRVGEQPGGKGIWHRGSQKGNMRRQLGSLIGRQADKGLLDHTRPLVSTPYTLFRSLPGAVTLQGYPLPQSCPLCEITGPLLYSQAQGMKEKRTGDRQQGKLTARLWDHRDRAASLALSARGKSA